MHLPKRNLRSRVVANDSFDLALICGPILLEQVVSVGLGWRFGVGFVEELLDAEKDLLDGDGWLPTLLLIQD